MDDRARVLAELLKDAVECRDAALAFSGGLDSGVLAYLMKDCPVKLYTVGIEGSKDVKNAEEAANTLGLELQIIDINEYDILEGILFLKRIEPSISALEVSFELPLYFVCSYADERDVYTGQGSDELFGGYAKYLENPELMSEDLNKLMAKTKPRETKIATLLGKELHTPYLDKRIIEFARNIPKELKIKNGVRKYVLREAARYLGVPKEIVEREKKAAQYGSGIWKIMKKMAKERDLSVEEFVKSL
ncbi:asparagine synthase C-terminal domain-containing protein [Candidatus Aciduliprofundum boonei]|uniref:Asparagine synthase n=1 Tax=Aciduliprofundum boonei (strain DSM 19572 / T469) TaxID=439481 RepID=D3TDA9_ACIB4|nr:asparagine synthase C-terminal domain-containing protein [Candidatus Aciduliprofundum boonei]ADD08544.1 asparagine synthase [Aciduliprofundum boonei T469]HII54623.1 asparagine synthase [Candidatus Aciduliprofundum boonei]